METIAFALGLIVGQLFLLNLDKHSNNKNIDNNKEQPVTPNGVSPVNLTSDLINKWQTGKITGGEEDE